MAATAEFGHRFGFQAGYLRSFEGRADDPYGMVICEWDGIQNDLMGSSAQGTVTDDMVCTMLSAYAAPSSTRR